MHLFFRRHCLFLAMLLVSSSDCLGQVVAVSDFSSSGRSLQRSRMTNFQDALYFSVGIDDTNVRELWRYDGVDLDLIRGGFVGESEISIAEFTEFRGDLYFRADTGTYGQELYRFDGNQVSLVADLHPGDASSSPVGLHVHNDALYFSAQEDESFNNLWRYDGSSVTRIASFDNPRASVVTGGSLGNDLIFAADDGQRGMELWKYDGNAVSLVSDIHAGAGDSFPREFTQLDDRIVFKATTPDTGQELWQYDGSTVSILSDTNPGPKSSDSGFLTDVDGELYFSGVAYGDRSLYRTEGDQVLRVLEGGGPIDVGTGQLAAIRGRRINGVELNELYLLDGTFFRTTVPSAGSFEVLQENLYFGCACSQSELFRLAKSGDSNADGVVDFADFLVMSSNFGSTGDWESGDFTNDGMVTFGDFLGLSQNFGKETEPAHRRARIQGVPEPSGFLVMLPVLFVLPRLRCRRG